MTLLEKIKINLDYLLGKADPKLYAEDYKSLNLTLKDWQKRWETFSGDDCFTWYGVDAENNVAEFRAEETYVPEIFFQDSLANKKLTDFFDNLPQITNGKIPDNLREEIKPSPEKIHLWVKESNKGIFIFEEPGDIYWYQENNPERIKYKRNPYELKSLPDKCLKVSDLPNEIQALLKPYHFEDLKFAECNFLDASKHFYCEE